LLDGLGDIGAIDYSLAMSKSPAADQLVVRDPKSGQFIAVRGAGALKGRLTIAKGLDLTKPIASQAIKKAQNSGTGSAKR
jgi:hypothetical protein